MLSARDVEEALKERLLRGAYPRGGPLPSVRALAAELGTSPSTVGRAVQELARQGWVTATSRRGAVVRRDLPAGETGVRDAEAAIRRLAVRWRLVGGDRAEFQELVARVADEVFQRTPRTVFLDCNPVDLQRGLDQVQREISVPVEPLLLEQAAAGSSRLRDANVLLTPYFHLAEARELAPDGAQVVPLNFVASEEAVRALGDLPADTLSGSWPSTPAPGAGWRRSSSSARPQPSSGPCSLTPRRRPGWSRRPTWSWSPTPPSCPGTWPPGPGGWSGWAGSWSRAASAAGRSTRSRHAEPASRWARPGSSTPGRPQPSRRGPSGAACGARPCPAARAR
jgi:DNA-binding transcriptional regulator YhcF (GntR family)